MKITELRIQNLGIIKAVRIQAAGKDKVVLSGRNEQGKTTVLDAIAYALSGGRSFSHLKEPIRKGESKAEVVVITDTMKVTRRWTKSGSTLEVTTKEGHAVKKAQEFLNELIGNLAFDPLLFTRKKPEEQYAELIEMAGIDLDKYDQEYKAKYSERTQKGRDRDVQLSRVQALKENLAVPTSDISAEQASKRIEVVKANVIAMRSKKEASERASIVVEQRKQQVAHIEQEIQRLRVALEESKIEIEKLEAAIEGFDRTEYESAVSHYRELEQVISSEKAVNDFKEEESKANTLSKEYEALTEELSEIKQNRVKALANAAMPLDSIKVGEDGVTFEGFPIEQLSMAQKMRMSIAIAMAKNPEFRVCLIRDAGLMDSKSMAVLEEMAEANDFQVWLEIMDESGEKGLVIEDGEVVKEN